MWYAIIGARETRQPRGGYHDEDWPQNAEHWAWLIEADEAEIRDWIGEMPTAEDRPDLYEE